MKQTIKTSRVAGQLEKMFRALNNRFFDGELPEVVISLKKTAGAYGHFTTGKVWKTGEERRYEINISSASLNQECAFLAGVLVHEMVHEYCAEHGIKDTSNNGVYHNKNFKHIAETHGLEVEHHPKYGWSITSPGLELLDARVPNLFFLVLPCRQRKVERWRWSHKRPPPSFPVSNLSCAQVVSKLLAIV